MIYRVTSLTPQVCKAIADLGTSFYAQAGLPGTFNPATFLDFWERCITGGIAAQWIFRHDDKIVGTIGMIMIPSPFTGETIAEETFWFVDENHRGTAGVRLFSEAEAWAKALGCDVMKVGYLNNLGAEKLHKFYERRGFTLLQTQFMKKL